MKLSRTLLALAALSGSAFVGCTAQQDTVGTESKNVGSVEMQLRLPSGSTIDSIHYDVSRTASSYDNAGDVPVQNSTLVRFQVGHIPAAAGYTMNLSATTKDGFACTAQAVQFDVLAGKTSAIQMQLHCGNGDTTGKDGNVQVNVGVDQDLTCSVADGLTALPLEVVVGSTVALHGYATGTGAVYAWSVAPSAAGAFAPANDAVTTFTCSQVGTFTVTMTVSNAGTAGNGACPNSTDTVQVTCSPQPGALCGNNAVESGESCDDGNTASNDGCSATCALESCGDGIKQTSEACDDGNTVSNDGCSAACAVEKCGDGVKQTGEACDDGNTVAHDGCENNCTLTPSASCGDGFLDAGETCDDKNTANNDGCSSTCQIEKCGDGVKQTSEQCDDGNTVDNDACSNLCVASRCGDGVVQTGEQCDDGNAVNTDACTTVCKNAACGDGFKQGAEACDDGNTTNGDGCSSTCTTEGPVKTACDTCRDTNCRNYLGVDLVHGCFEAVNGDFGADPTDPKFIQDCVNVITCARANHCAYSADKAAAGCYCGSNSVDACAASGPAADAKCVPQWQAATRTTVNADVQVRFTDLSYPAGWAYFLLECDTKSCPDCQVP
jgi:cysteine-rich repeat protein